MRRIMVLTYTRGALLRLRKGNGYPDGSVIVKLKALNLFHARSHKKRRPASKDMETKKKLKEKPPSIPPHHAEETPPLDHDLPTLLLTHVASLSGKMEELALTTRSVGADVVAVTVSEACQATPEIPSISDYILFHHPRTNERGGGVALFCRPKLCPAQLQVHAAEGTETLWVRVTPHHSSRQTASIIYCVVYHPQRGTKNALLSHLIHTSDALRNQYPCAKLVLCGHVNELDTKGLQEHLHLSQLISVPTQGNDTLGLILTDMAAHQPPPRPLPPLGRSIHLPVVWSQVPHLLQHPLVTTHQDPHITDTLGCQGAGEAGHPTPRPEVIDPESTETKWEA